MTTTEEIFIQENHPLIKVEPYDLNQDGNSGEFQEKIGEIFRIAPGHLLYLCSHCCVKFSGFMQFVAHIEKHFLEVFSISLKSFTPDSCAEDGDGDGIAQPSVGSGIDAEYAERNDDWFHEDLSNITIDSKYVKRSTNASRHQSSTIEVVNLSSENECVLCKKRFRHAIYLHRHMKLHSNPISDQNVLHKGQILDHTSMKTFHATNSGFQCNDRCDAKFEVPSDLHRHEATHPIASAVLERTYECHQCHEVLATLPECYNHLTDIHWNSTAGSLQCANCKMCLKSQSTLKRHMKICTTEQKSQLKCQICSEELPSKRLLRAHRHTKHPLQNPGERTFKCPNCGKVFPTYSQKQYHMLCHRLDARVANNQFYKCPICAKEFVRPSNFNQHVQNHRDDSTFQCDICQKTLRVRYRKEHMQRHTNEKKYQCAHCGKQFISNSAMNQHMHWHSEERKFQCDLCPKNYKTAYKLKVHTQMHTGKFLYNCKICGRGFSWRVSLKKHSLSVHGQPLESTAAVAHSSLVAKIE